MPDEVDQPEVDETSSSLRPFWSGTITFGLVSIPVNLFPANRSNRASLRMLGPEGTPLSRRYFSAESDKELAPDDMVRGFETGKDRFVVVTDEELERLAPEKSRDIDLRRFVEASQIPPLYFERSYFLVPAGESTKAYRLLAATMEKTVRAGIATFVMRGKEYLVAIFSENGVLRAETMRFSDEIRSAKAIGLPQKEKTARSLTERFEKAIAKLKKDELSESDLRDEDAGKLLKLAKQKQSRKQDLVEAAVPEGKAEVVDIMAVLQRSLSQARRQAPKRDEHSTGKKPSKPTKSPRKRSA